MLGELMLEPYRPVGTAYVRSTSKHIIRLCIYMHSQLCGQRNRRLSRLMHTDIQAQNGDVRGYLEVMYSSKVIARRRMTDR